METTRQLFYTPTGQLFNTRRQVKEALGISGTQFGHLFKAGKIKSITSKAHLEDEYNTSK